jgi:hypothetical protein
MSVEQWVKEAVADAERRGLPELKPLIEGLAEATRVLREAAPGGEADGPTDD